MGLDVCAKGLKDSYHGSYMRYYRFRIELIKLVYGEEMAELFQKDKLTPEEVEFWNSRCRDDLDLFLLHSDCDGKFSPKECRTIYNAIKDLDMDFESWDLGVPYNMLDRWKSMFKYCADRGVNMYYR